MDTNAHTCTQIHTCIHTYLNSYKYVCIDTYKYVHTCIYTQYNNVHTLLLNYSGFFLCVCDSIINNQTPALTTTTIEKSQTLLSVP